MTTRTIDALCDQFVEDYAALDPSSATVFGVAGHDDRLTDLSPDRVRRPRRARARAPSMPSRPPTPVDEREAVARDAFLERHRLELELEAAGLSPIADVGAVERPARGPRGLRPDADARSRRRSPTSAPAWPPSPLLSRACASRSPTRPPGPRRGRRGSTPRSPSRCAAGPARPATAATSSPAWSRGSTSTPDRAAGARERGQPGLRRLRDVPVATSSSRRAATRRPSGASATPWPAATSSVPSVDLDETYAWGWAELKRLADLMDETAEAILPGASVDEAVAHLEADPVARRPRPRGLPRLDAGPRRSHHRRDGRRALRHPRADPPDRVHARAHQRRRHLLHRPLRGLHPSRPHVVVGARRHRGLPPVARGHDRLPRGRPRAPPPGRADGLPPGDASTAGSG